VHLVDTNGKGVEAVTEKGIVANGKEYELDCIIWGTGYDVAGGFSSTSAIHIYGRNGISLAEKWKEGPATLFGMSTAAFPNMFFISILQAAFFPNFHHMVDEQSSHIGHIISNCEKRDVKTLELSQEGEDAWVQYVLDNTSQRRAALANCTPGYYNNEGANTKKQAKATIFGVGVNEYINKIKEWRDNGSFEGFKVEYAPAAVAAH
jgi:cyclohexanone monooxygenase